MRFSMSPMLPRSATAFSPGFSSAGGAPRTSRSILPAGVCEVSCGRLVFGCGVVRRFAGRGREGASVRVALCATAGFPSLGIRTAVPSAKCRSDARVGLARRMALSSRCCSVWLSGICASAMLSRVSPSRVGQSLKFAFFRGGGTLVVAGARLAVSASSSGG
ncbi:MAG: hypothetical protein ACD_10C00319G0001 [uncultured bacterium]|nr:MAG: hypothetical protein ACD_10C00319G0001 [uncultured bacterium]